MLTFSAFDQKYVFGANSVQIIKNICLSWNYMWYTEWNDDVHFFGFYWKYKFWANLVQKNKILSLSWNLIPRLTGKCKIRWWCCKIRWWCFCYRPKISFVSKLSPKNQDCQFRLIFSTNAYLNVRDSIVISILFFFFFFFFI